MVVFAVDAFFLCYDLQPKSSTSSSILSAVDVSLRCFESKEQAYSRAAAYTDAAPV